MRILYATCGSTYPLLWSGGAWRSAHELLVGLTRQGATCAVAAADPQAVAAAGGGKPLRFDCGYPVTVREKLLPCLDDILAEFRPDVVCSHLEGAHEVLRRSARAGVRGAWFIRNPECVDHPQEQLDEARALGVSIFASSPFLARHIEEAHGIPAVPLYSPVDVSSYRSEPAASGAGAITMINPVVDKGLTTVVGLLLRLPDLPFLLVEGWQGDNRSWEQLERVLGRFPNVRLVRAVTDMRQVYRQTRVLIVPSRWQEGFGRVVAEAHASGIPVVASRVGGLADLTAGTVLVDDFTSSDAWAEAVESLWKDRDRYDRLSREALEHSETAPYRSEKVAERFLAELSAEVGG